MIRLGIFETHPIQYFAPIWRTLTATPGLYVRDHFLSDMSVRGEIDPEFGVPVAWDVPLTAGYDHVFLRRDADLSRPRTVRLPNAAAILAEGKFDAILLNGYKYPFQHQLMRAAWRRGVAIIQRADFNDVTPHYGRGRLKTWLRGMYLRRLYRGVSAFCYSGLQAKRHLENHGVSSEKQFFSPYCVDGEMLAAQRTSLDKLAVRRELGIDSSHFVFLFSGKLIPRKAPLLLIEALAKLPDSKNVALLIVGDGELRAQVEQAGRQLLGNRLHMAGFVNQSQIGKYFVAADAFVLPSHYETWGLVVNEAMHFGLPVVVSDRVGCHEDLLIHGETGYRFIHGDAAELSLALKELIGNPTRAREFGEAAKHHIVRYSVENAAAGIRRAMLACVNHRGSEASHHENSTPMAHVGVIGPKK